MKKKSLIFITMEIPYPCNSGGRKYTWERIIELKRQGYDIVLFSLKESDEKIYKQEYDKYIKKSYFYDRKNKLKSVIKNINLPFSVATRTNIEMKKDIENFIKNNKVDAIILDTVLMGNNIVSTNIPYILTQHNIEYKTFKSMGKTCKNILKKIIFYREYLLTKKFEKRYYKNKLFKGITFISEEDKEFFEKEFGKIASYELIPIGVEKKEINYIDESKGKIVFTGKMDYQPNVDAVVYFVNNIFKKLKRKIPIAKFYIVGKSPTKKVIDLENVNGVRVTGQVKSIENYIKDANIVVIPLLSGGGVKIKLFEALQYKRLVISTQKGVEGTSFKDEKHILVADNNDKFISLCIDAIENYSAYRGIPEEGNKYMIDNYSWEKIGAKYKVFIDEICNL